MARLGDARALPGLLAALDSDLDARRAIQVAGHLPQAADQLVPGSATTRAGSTSPSSGRR
ncbi:hypothetical protein [Streptomyces sp. NPDC096132]|uniref:hypothetical protein n=1 Tax=Streptomyces sp. NPDC096132 TaxID=3366075 RepID=UPI00380803D0